MCDLLSETSRISTSENYIDKEKFSQSDDSICENLKDSAPELLAKSDNFEKIIPADILEKLTSGILPLHEDDMHKFSSSLKELKNNQCSVIETLQQENKRLSEALTMYPLDNTFSRIKYYFSKVQALKREMNGIHDRAAKLKKRAMRLQQYKQKEALQKELQRDRDLERDKQLAPKIATKF